MAEIGPLSQASCCHYWKPTSGSLFPKRSNQRRPLSTLQWFSQVSGVLHNPPDRGHWGVWVDSGLTNKHLHKRNLTLMCVFWWCSLSQGRCIIVSTKRACWGVCACCWCTRHCCLLLSIYLSVFLTAAFRVFMIWLQPVGHLLFLLPTGDLCVFCPAPPHSSPSHLSLSLSFSPFLPPSARDTQHQ